MVAINGSVVKAKNESGGTLSIPITILPGTVSVFVVYETEGGATSTGGAVTIGGSPMFILSSQQLAGDNARTQIAAAVAPAEGPTTIDIVADVGIVLAIAGQMSGVMGVGATAGYTDVGGTDTPDYPVDSPDPGAVLSAMTFYRGEVVQLSMVDPSEFVDSILSTSGNLQLGLALTPVTGDPTSIQFRALNGEETPVGGTWWGCSQALLGEGVDPPPSSSRRLRRRHGVGR